jgi:hypothetical protein
VEEQEREAGPVGLRLFAFLIVAIVVIVAIDFFFFGEQCGVGGCCMGVRTKKRKI